MCRMKVYLIKSPEYETNSFNAVCDLLKSFEGPIKFISSRYQFNRDDYYFLKYDLFPKHPFKYPTNDVVVKFDSSRDYPLSWRELFQLCNDFRKTKGISKDSFVVLLTKRKNALNWFSSFDGDRNIFVHTAEWDEYTNVNPEYPITHQVVENILQFLMKADLLNVPNNYIHEPLKGCINDFCYNKNQIIIKLQTANICAECMLRIREKGIGLAVQNQIKNILNGIRNEFMFKIENPPTDALTLVVEEHGRVLLPDEGIEFRLTPLHKTLYIFYLNHPEGVQLSDLYEYKDELLNIYQKLSVFDQKDRIYESIDKLINPVEGYFSQTKSKINRTIANLLGENLSSHYKIKGSRGKPFYIQLSDELKDIRI